MTRPDSPGPPTEPSSQPAGPSTGPSTPPSAGPRPDPSAEPARVSTGDVVTVELHGWAHGGEAVGRLPDGMAVFVGYAIPGEVVRVRITTRRKRWARADLVEVLTPSPHRVQPPCPYFGPGRCGGCQLQHIDPEHQRALKAQVLTEQLQRIGGQEDPPVRGVAPVEDGWPQGYRAWARMAVTPEGRLGFRRPGSHDVQAIDHCLLMDDRAAATRDDLGDGWAGVQEVAFIAGDDGAMAVLHPGPGGVPAAPDGDVGIAIQGSGPAPTSIRPPGSITIAVGDHAFRVSAGAFFQAGPPAAAAIATAVADAAGVRPGDTVLDLYAGVGLLSTWLAGDGVEVIAVEGDPVAAEDARHNLRDRAQVLQADVGDALADLDAADVVVLDPPRSGAGEAVCRQLVDLAPRRIVYVACDPAALARDTRLLADLGMRLVDVVGIDAFGHTAHLESIAVFEPRPTPEDPAG